MKAGELAARAAADHGRYIFIYNNIRTNQVIYSLTRYLDNNASLKQLPYLGKKTVPAALRKDLWQPLATVSFPSGSQGLSAYHKLREFRTLHEVSWDPETDVVPLKRKDRKKKLMDQKANSIADLAAVLGLQHKMGDESRERAVRRDKHLEMVEEHRWRKVELLAKRAESGELEAVEQQLKKWQEDYERRLQLARDFMGTKREGSQEAPIKNCERCMLVLRQKRNKMQRAQAAIAFRNRQSTEELSAATEDTAEGSPAKSDAAQLPSKGGPSPLPKYGRLRKQMIRFEAPIFAAEGVKIQWANILDAGHADSWPPAVKHDILGPTRHVAPDPNRTVTANSISEEEERHMEENVQLDGEASEEGGEAEDKGEEDEREGRRHSEETQGEENSPVDEDQFEQQKPRRARSLPRDPLTRAGIRSLLGRQRVEPSERLHV